MEKQTVFIKRYPSKGEFPNCKGQSYRVYVITNIGIVYYDKYEGREYDIEWWLEEIKLPSEEEILNEVKDRNHFLKLGFIKGANFILNKLKGETK